MAIRENPFTPSFGEIPAHLAGRNQIVADFIRALESKNRRPELTTIISGARGTGKTTLLSLVAEKAEERGWICASTTATPGMLEDLETQARKRAAHLTESASKTHVESVGIPQIVSLKLNQPEENPGNWRSRMEDLIDQLKMHDAGLLITVDEIDVNLDEMVQLAAIYQHFVRENRKVALVMAGLPSSVSNLLSSKTVSFLRRAQGVSLGRIDDFEIESAMRKTIEEAGRSIAPHNLETAVKAIDGFPFLMQLIGYRAWDEHPAAEEITAEDIRRGIGLATQEMKSRILEATYRELSAEDLRFLEAMLQDKEESSISDIGERLGRSSSQIAQYRSRLISAGVIGPRRRGVIGFDLPFFREFLEEKLAG